MQAASSGNLPVWVLIACSALLLLLAIPFRGASRRKALARAVAPYLAPPGARAVRSPERGGEGPRSPFARLAATAGDTSPALGALVVGLLELWNEVRPGTGSPPARAIVLFAGLTSGLSLGAGVWLGLEPWVALAGASIATMSALWWGIRLLRRHRSQSFLQQFPDAVDIIVRGVKAGLPVAECLRMVSRDAREPVRGLFGFVVREQALGIAMEEVLKRLSRRMPLPEVRLFVTVLSIQARSGGGLSEALSNLSAVLRARRKLQLRVRAISAEAKSSAMIVAAMPVVLGIVLHFASPGYIALLFTHGLGRAVLGACAVWMTIGVIIMRRMIDFRT